NGHPQADRSATALASDDTITSPGRGKTSSQQDKSSDLLRHDGEPLRLRSDVEAPAAARSTTRTALPLAVLILVAIGLALWRLSLTRPASASLPMHSIAVLPLDNFSGDPSQEYFVDGMTDELTTDLAKVSSLHVTYRTSVMRYKGTKKSLPE